MSCKIGFLSHSDLNLYLFRSPIMKELISRGWEVYAICPKGDKNEALKNMGLSIVNYEIKRESLNPLLELKAINNIYKAIQNLKLDLLHTFTAKPNIYGTIAGRKASVPIIVNLVEGLGSFYTSDSIKNLVVRRIIETLYKYTFTLSDICIFVNGDDPNYMINKKIIKPQKVKIIKSVGIDTGYFNPDNYTDEVIERIKNSLEIKNDKTVILMVARAIWDKGIREYYKAAEIINKKYDNIKFIFVGDIEPGNPSCASIDFLKSGKVRWLGFRDDIRDLMAICDIFVLPSYREGLPRALLEAASMGKPIVTTNTTGCRDVVEDGKNGFLVPVRDSLSLANKIEISINNDMLRRQMGNYSRRKAVEEFELKKVVKQYIELYEFLLSARGIKR
ncbi:MAG: glycosyltransferase family 4 protein [Geminocystis sp.]|nr:glycosyltransferase family 4 protein [Geminocystis sp.]